MIRSGSADPEAAGESVRCAAMAAIQKARSGTGGWPARAHHCRSRHRTRAVRCRGRAGGDGKDEGSHLVAAHSRRSGATPVPCSPSRDVLCKRGWMNSASTSLASHAGRGAALVLALLERARVREARPSGAWALQSLCAVKRVTQAGARTAIAQECTQYPHKCRDSAFCRCHRRVALAGS